MQGLGTVLDLPGLSNTAITFAFIWSCEKGCEQAAEWSAWVAMFLGSLALWQAALALRSYPGWLTSLVSAWSNMPCVYANVLPCIGTGNDC